MEISLNNSLTRSKVLFKPIDPGNVRMYVCGPTVYDRAHIGNARAVVVFDILYRILRHKYKNNVTYVRNITDVDDKINAAAKAQAIDISELTKKTTAMFHEDMAALSCLEPDFEPRATQHIPEMIEMIELLIANGNAYAASGHVLFRVASDAEYGHLSGRSTDEMLAGARVEVAPYKENPMDFVLWKPSSPDEPGWDSAWGRGRPGWHIECSAMSIKYLSENFDIHGGGADLTFPHHENEIAQSCCAHPGSLYAKYWVHNGFLSVNGEKMSKSLGNFVTVHDLLDNKGVMGEMIRLALISTHYKKPLNWNKKARYDAQTTLNRFYSVIKNNPKIDKNIEIPQEFLGAIYDDMNISLALAIMNRFVDKNDASTLKKCGNFLGILNMTFEEYSEALKNTDLEYIGFLAQEEDSYFLGFSDEEIKRKVEPLIELRRAARTGKNWAESDRIRDELLAMGIIVEDKPGGVMGWRVK